MNARVSRTWVLAILGVFLGPQRTAAAAACCGESHGLGDRLAVAERAALSSSVRLRERVGAWDPSGDYHPIAGGDHDRELRVDLAWLVRVDFGGDTPHPGSGGALQLGASVPALVTWRSVGGAASSGGGVGDVTALARYDLIPVTGRGLLPGVALTLATTIPTGRSSAESTDPTAADVTGLGAGELKPGISIEKDWTSGWYALGLASVGLRTTSRLDGDEVALAPRLTLAALGGRTSTSGLSVGLGAVFEREAAPSIAGQVTPRSARQRTAALLFGACDLDARWTLQASLESDLPIAGLGQNEVVGVAGAVGGRYAWGRTD